ncbi:tyrosine-type recombinase/integrase [Sphingobium sp.]|uniref:tyrosine-type recombinase/integrase n=1 Tax=Sphingobium sp. TaxID=1912891 RepID=UPI003BB4F9D1
MAAVAKRKWMGPDGRECETWVVRWKDEGGRHRQKSFDRKKDADAHRSQVEIEMRQGIHRPEADRMSVADLCSKFLAHNEDRRKDGRIGNARIKDIETSIRIHIVPHIGALRLADVGLHQLEQWRTSMMNGGKMSPHTARKHVQILGQAFEHGRRRRWLFSSPVPDLIRDLHGMPKRTVTQFSVDQVRAVLLELQRENYKGIHKRANAFLRCAVHLAAFCGLRIGEVRGLTVGAIDFDRRMLKVKTNLTDWDELKGPKTDAGKRTVALPDHVAALLSAYMERYHIANERDLMFTQDDGRSIQSGNFHRGTWGPLLFRAGISTDRHKPSHHFHALRHFAASWWIACGWSLPDVAKSLGHSKVDMTLSVYTHALEERGQDVEAMQDTANRLYISGAPRENFTHVGDMGRQLSVISA